MTGKNFQIIKRKLFKKSDGKCFYCKVQMTKGSATDHLDTDMTLDHLIPRSMGGSMNPKNLVVCCRGCNAKRGTKNLREFAAEHFPWLLYPKVEK